ncbi:MAG: cysteine--tRNA ligase [Candidatus Methylomirabilales bacterium]
MGLRIYNTLTRQKEVFEPLTPGQVRMYVCGITAYDLCHIGHARSALVFDVIRRYLEFTGYRVLFVRNFTDVDDKIIKRAEKDGVSAREVSERYIAEYQKDMDRLGVCPASFEPKATDHIPSMIALIERLLARGFAYVVDGDVYFEVRKFPRYGRLSGKHLDELMAGARVEVDERKRDAHDFALWKSAKPNEPSWESPWGPGRPGWHIECSAMSMERLGESFDIHGGGEDLIFPHHDCEIAQSEAATGAPFVRYWIHNGFVQINQEKMSKSLGNFFTVREIFEKSPYGLQVTAEALRYFLLGTHYRSPLDFSDDALWEAKRALDRFYDLFLRLDEASAMKGPGDALLPPVLERFGEAFRQAMDDDFNTPAAIAQLQVLRGELNKLLETGLSKHACKDAREDFRSCGRVLDLLQLSVGEWEFGMVHIVRGADSVAVAVQDEGRLRTGFLTDEEIEQKLVQRNEARLRKDFAKADEIRAELAAFGITIEDRPDGTSRWKR